MTAILPGGRPTPFKIANDTSDVGGARHIIPYRELLLRRSRRVDHRTTLSFAVSPVSPVSRLALSNDAARPLVAFIDLPISTFERSRWRRALTKGREFQCRMSSTTNLSYAIFTAIETFNFQINRIFSLSQRYHFHFFFFLKIEQEFFKVIQGVHGILFSFRVWQKIDVSIFRS